MAGISSYPQASPKGSDLVLGVQTYVEGDDSTIGNHTKTFTINDINSLVAQDSGSSLYTTKTVELTPAQMLSLNGNGVLELIPAPGEGKVIVVSEILLFLDYNSTAYNFSLFSGSLNTTFGTSTPISNIDYRTSLNKSSDYYVSVQELMEPKVNQPLNLLGAGGISVTQGNSTAKFSIVYRILNSTTLL
jgi:hypothetical protein